MRVGDIFYHIHPNGYQLWLWQIDNGYARWKAVTTGVKRGDGRVLSLTERQRNPTWVSETWYLKLAKKTH